MLNSWPAVNVFLIIIYSDTDLRGKQRVKKVGVVKKKKKKKKKKLL